MMGSVGSRGAPEPADPVAQLSELLKLLEPILNEPALARQLLELRAMLDELGGREAAVAVREAALEARERKISGALRSLGEL